MSRLIDADANREEFKKTVYLTLIDCGATAKEKFNLIMTAFDSIPTAYDVDKVVDVLVDTFGDDMCELNGSYECCIDMPCDECKRNRMLELIRKGGVNE